jgi:hypothetical protein
MLYTHQMDAIVAKVFIPMLKDFEGLVSFSVVSGKVKLRVFCH